MHTSLSAGISFVLCIVLSLLITMYLNAELFKIFKTSFKLCHRCNFIFHIPQYEILGLVPYV